MSKRTMYLKSSPSVHRSGLDDEVLWSLQQQVNTMSKYGVVANSVEFEELQRSLDEELQKYKSHEEIARSERSIPTMTRNMNNDMSGTESPPPSPDPPPKYKTSSSNLHQSLYSKESNGSLYSRQDKRSYSELYSPPGSMGQMQYSRPPSDLDYFPTKYAGSPKVYPKSPTPISKNYNGHSLEKGFRKFHTAERSSLMVAYNNGLEEFSPPAMAVSPEPLPDKRDNLGVYEAGKQRRQYNSHISGLADQQAISPPPRPPSRGYASSMPFLDSENIEPNKQQAATLDTNKMARTFSQISEVSRTTNISRASVNRTSRVSVNKKCPVMERDDESAGDSSSASSEPDLNDIINILSTSANLALVSSAAGAIQHLAFNHDDMKNKIREAGAIPILIHLLSLDDLVCISALGALRNLSYGRHNNENKIAIQDAHGVTLLIQLLNTTESFEIQELVTGVFWNLSSSDNLKLNILRNALDPIVKNIIIPQSGWSGGAPRNDRMSYTNINWTTVFRNASGCLKNLSSAGLEGRKIMRACPGLVDALLWTVRAAQGKNDVDNKAVENAVCILRNLSYRLESEVPPDCKYGQPEDWRSRGVGGGQFKKRETPEESSFKRKKGGKKQKDAPATPLPEHTSGVGLLWQTSVVRPYLDLLLECSNPETLEGAAGSLQNLTACGWQPAQAIREAVRKEKGLSVITSLLRMPNDPVVRATAFCLRNLALDIKNKDLLGKNAIHDLIKRLPGGEATDGISDVTISAIVCAVHEIVQDNTANCTAVKENRGIPRLIDIAISRDLYSRQCVLTTNQILACFWQIKDMRRLIKSEGWNISMYNKLTSTLDKSDGMEYDETKNQFKMIYNKSNSPEYTKSPEILGYDTAPRGHPEVNNELYSPIISYEDKANFDPTFDFHRPERPYEQIEEGGHNTLQRGPPVPATYAVADSWV